MWVCGDCGFPYVLSRGGAGDVNNPYLLALTEIRIFLFICSMYLILYFASNVAIQIYLLVSSIQDASEGANELYSYILYGLLGCSVLTYVFVRAVFGRRSKLFQGTYRTVLVEWCVPSPVGEGDAIACGRDPSIP
jgi:hypothetical protein